MIVRTIHVTLIITEYDHSGGNRRHPRGAMKTTERLIEFLRDTLSLQDATVEITTNLEVSEDKI